MATTTVRARLETREKLRRLSERMGQSMPDLLAASVDLLERETLLDEANAAFATLRSDSSGWGLEIEERRLWQATLGDDLDEAHE